MNKYTYSTAFLLLSTFSPNTFAKTDTGVYKWIDAEQKVHYTDRPAPGKMIKIENDIEEKIRKAAGLPAKTTPQTGSHYDSETKQSEDNKADNDKPKHSEPTKTTHNQTQKQTVEVYAKKLAAYCEQQTNNLKALQQDLPIAWEEEGETALLSTAQRKEKTKEIQIVINNKCNSSELSKDDKIIKS